MTLVKLVGVEVAPTINGATLDPRTVQAELDDGPAGYEWVYLTVPTPHLGVVEAIEVSIPRDQLLTALGAELLTALGAELLAEGRVDTRRETERADGAEVAWQDTADELDQVRAERAELVAEVEKLRAQRYGWCANCGSTRGGCADARRDGAIKCCPDCDHRDHAAATQRVRELAEALDAGCIQCGSATGGDTIANALRSALDGEVDQ